MHNIRCALTTRYPLHHPSERYRPFFIVGAPRSGTTLLRRILMATPGVHIPPETFVMGKVTRNWKRYQNLDWSDMVLQTLGTFQLHEHFGEFQISLSSLVAPLRSLKGNDRNLARIINEIMIAHAGTEDPIRWGEKTPGHSLFMNEIAQVFPDVQFVHILRDGADCIASWLREGFTSDTTEAAQRWQSHVTAVAEYTARHPDQVCLVRYEELVQNPEPAVEQVCRFLDLPFRPEMITATSHVDQMGDASHLPHLQNVRNAVTPSRIGKGRASLTAEQAKIINQVAGKELERFGYPLLPE